MDWLIPLILILIIFPEIPMTIIAFIVLCVLEVLTFIWKRKWHALAACLVFTAVYYWSWL